MITALVKKEIKNNIKLYIIFLFIITIYVFSLLAMYNPALQESLISLEKSMPEVLAFFGMQDKGTTLLDFIINYLYHFVLIITPFIYSGIMCYRLVGKYYENGSMAYFLNSHYSRKQFIKTQGITFILGLTIMILFTTVLTILSCLFMFKDELDILRFLLLNFGLLSLQYFIAAICFISTCAFTEIKHSIGLGVGICSFFIVIQMLSQVYENSFLKYCNPLSLFNPEKIIQYDLFALLSIGILLISSIILVTFAIKIFTKKDLPL